MDSFPFLEYEPSKLIKEFQKIGAYNGPIKNSNRYYAVSNMFFQKSRMSTPSHTKASCIQFWIRKKEYILEWHKKYPKMTLFRAICFLNRPPGQFPITLCAGIYNLLQPKVIIDPYAGWGDRAVTAMANNIDYIGFDSNPNLQPAYEDMIYFYKSHTTSNWSKVKMTFDKCEKHILTMDIPNPNDTIVLTSPPFWGKNKKKLLENYQGTEESYQTFLRESLFPVLNKLISTVRWVGVYMPEEMYEDIVKQGIPHASNRIEFKTQRNNVTKTHHQKKINYIYAWDTREASAPTKLDGVGRSPRR